MRSGSKLMPTRRGIAARARNNHFHARSAALPPDEYHGFNHLSPTAHGGQPVDRRLAQLDVRRHIALTVLEFARLLPMIVWTEPVFSIRSPDADEMVAQNGFASAGAPPKPGPMRF